MHEPNVYCEARGSDAAESSNAPQKNAEAAMNVQLAGIKLAAKPL